MTCPCGQTYGTCGKHPGEAPQIATFMFVRDDGVEWSTWIRRPKRMTDATWEEAQLECARTLSDKFLELYKGATAKPETVASEGETK